MTQLLVLGDLGWDECTDEVQLGGRAARFAYYSQMLGEKIAFASAVGSDDAGQAAIEGLMNLGFDTRLIQIDPDIPTQRCVLSVCSNGQQSDTLPSRAACDFILRTPEVVAEALRAEAFYYNARGLRLSGTRESIAQLLEVMPRACKVFDARDIRLVPDSVSLEGFLRQAQVLHVGIYDLPYMCNLLGLPELEPFLFCSAMVERFKINTCLVTAPPTGIYGVSSDQTEIYQSLEGSPAPSCMGWYEGFLSGFIYRYLLSNDLQSSCHFGARYAALLGSRNGQLGCWSASEVSQALSRAV